MKYAVLGDIHANLEALTAVLKDIHEQGIEALISTGDVVGYGANPAECLDTLIHARFEIVQGNHDFYAAGDMPTESFRSAAAKTIDWTRTQLTATHRKFLAKLPLVKTIDNFTLCHSSLWQPEEWNYVFNQEAANRSLSTQRTQICFIGHTHVPVIFAKNQEIKMQHDQWVHLDGECNHVINPGSVGQPRDGNPLTGYVIFNPTENSALLRRIPYDIKTAQEKILTAGLPHQNAKRLELGR